MDESLLLHASSTNPMRLQSIIVKMSSATVKRILQLVIRYICFYPCVYRIALPKVLLCDILCTVSPLRSDFIQSSLFDALGNSLDRSARGRVNAMVFFGQLVKQRLKELETAIRREDTVMEFNIHQLSFNLKKKEEEL